MAVTIGMKNQAQSIVESFFFSSYAVKRKNCQKVLSWEQMQFLKLLIHSYYYSHKGSDISIFDITKPLLKPKKENTIGLCFW